MLFVTAGVGAGHNQAARALQAGLAEADPTLPTDWVDILDYANPLFRLAYAGGYATAVTRLPRAYGWGFRRTDRPGGPRRTLSERLRISMETLAVRKFTAWLMDQRPALVVHTHFLAPPVIGRLIDRGAGGLAHMVVVTDYYVHRYWYAEHVDRYFIAADSGIERLAGFGVDPGRITVSGIPVHPKWTAPFDADAARRAWKLPADRPLVIVSGGALFTVGPIDEMVERMCRLMPEAIIAVLAGTDKDLLGRLGRRSEAGGDCPQLRPVGFTDRVHELSRLASLIVGKPGGMTVTESLTAGTPMLLLSPVPGQEAHNADWLARGGAAVVARPHDDVAARAAELIHDPPALQELRRHALALARPARDTIVQHIRRRLAEM
ncbi:MAG: hypothetical protein GX591_10180 [Planctomycetes bacterium]|nr:hypothetical protein [Planctomycetota bacterium]